MCIRDSLGIWSKLSLYMPAVLQGEVWRLITFIFVPSASTPISLLLTLYLMWLIGHTLEQSWGDFRFNVYYLLGVLGAILAAVITGWGTTYYLNLSLFFAFAMLYPCLLYTSSPSSRRAASRGSSPFSSLPAGISINSRPSA